MSCGLLRLPTLDTPLAPAAHFNLLPIPPPPSTVPPLHPPFYSKLLPTTTSMSTILRTLRNLRKIGIKEYAHQLQNIGDTKAGTYIASDRYGNKYYENLEQELPCSFSPSPYPVQPPLPQKYIQTPPNEQFITHPPPGGLTVRTRWVDYKDSEYDPSQIEPGWHAWMSYLVDKPPTEDALLRLGQRSWELSEHRPTLTATRAAYKPYST